MRELEMDVLEPELGGVKLRGVHDGRVRGRRVRGGGWGGACFCRWVFQP